MLVKECSPEKGRGGPRTGLGEEVSKKVVSAGDRLLPDPAGSPGARVIPQRWSHLETGAGGGLLHTLVSRSQAMGFLREHWERGVMLPVLFSYYARAPLQRKEH